jgi:thiamine kinase
MQARDLDELCRGVVPGGGAVEWQALGRGLSSDTYRVERDGIAYALKVPAGNSFDLGMDFDWEAKLLERAGSARLAPPLVYCDVERAILLTRWMQGRVWLPTEAARADNLRQIALTLRRVHALPAPSPQRMMNPESWIELYSRALARVNAAPLDATLRRAAEVKLQELKALPAAAAAVCHSDLHVLNLIQGDQALILLDWEYAHVSEPFWDLSGWSANNDFAASSQQALLTSYLGSAPSALEWQRFRLLMWLYDYVCVLWSELYLRVARAKAGATRARISELDARLRDPAHYPT